MAIHLLPINSPETAQRHRLSFSLPVTNQSHPSLRDREVVAAIYLLPITCPAHRQTPIADNPHPQNNQIIPKPLAALHTPLTLG
ncbi:hypothetical protein [Acidiphilium sp. MT5]